MWFYKQEQNLEGVQKKKAILSIQMDNINAFTEEKVCP